MWRDLRDRLLRPLLRGPLTARHPTAAPALPSAARGLPVLDPARCEVSAVCVTACPTGAIMLLDGAWQLDLGRCVFCAACADACPEGAIALTGRVELAVVDRQAAFVSSTIAGSRS